MRVMLLFAVLLAVSPAVLAQEDWFTIEVIVFEHRDGATDDEEFPRDPGQPDLLATARLVPATVPPTLRDFEQLDPASMQLADAWRSLRRSSRYDPLVIAGWTQVARAPGQALPVALDIFTGEPLEPIQLQLPVEPEALEPEALDTETAAPVDDGADVEPKPTSEFVAEEPAWLVAERLLAQYLAPQAPERLRGTVRLQLQRFLNVELDLLVATDEPLPPEEDVPGWYERRDTIIEEVRMGLLDEAAAAARLDALQREPQVVTFRLRESRQVRSGEVHYFDHPRLGAIVTVRPLPREAREQREQNLADAMAEAAGEISSEPVQDPF